MAKINNSFVAWGRWGLALLAVLFAGCSEQNTHTNAHSDGIIHLEQGWDSQLRTKAHHTSFGSRLIPVNWLLHLETETHGKLISQASI